MKTRVYVTTDVECAEERNVGGRRLPPQGYDVRVWGRFANQRRELGIDLLMRELEAEGLRGTFYTEVLGSKFFGEGPLREVVATMLARGHDVQLHAHPIQRVADWRTRGEAPAADDIGLYDVARQAELLAEGVEILERCGVPKGDVTSFRAGNFGASNATWEAMARTGLSLSSSYNPCYFAKNCKMRSPLARAGLFQVLGAREGDERDAPPRAPAVWELPIANLRDRSGAHRHVQITAVSLAETTDFLLEAHGRGVGEVVIVTHSFELCHLDDVAAKRGRLNSVNFARFRGLCRFLARRSDLFEVDTAGALGRRLRDGLEPARAAGPIEWPPGKRRYRALRFVEQAVKRLEARAPFSFATLGRP